MNLNQKNKWEKIQKIGRSQFIWFRGVFGWGVFTAALWSLTMSYIKGDGSGFWDYFTIAILIFPVGGYLWGAWMWKRCEFALHPSLTELNKSLFGKLDKSIFPDDVELPIGKNLSVSMKPAARLAWLGIVLFSGFFILSLSVGQVLLGLPFVFFIGLSVYLILVSGSVEVNSSRIHLSIPLGQYEVGWDEVNNIETDIQRRALVFIGFNKRVAIAGPVWWAGKDKNALITFLNAEVERRGIEIKQSQKALFKFSKNSKVKRG
ncbi:MAG: hypothetical protein ABIJ31_03755 [Pseudomonadota bacterium]